MKRTRLGDWTCPSGNNVIAYYRREGDHVGHLDLEWDRPPSPSMSAADQVFYLGVIRPEMIRLAAEYLERLGPRLIVEVR